MHTQALAGIHPTIAAALAPHIATPESVADARRAGYLTRLKRADWHHEHSDDMRVVRAGRQELAALLLDAAEIDPNYELWNKHCPPECRRGFDMAEHIKKLAASVKGEPYVMWPAWSTGESLMVAVILNDFEALNELGYTMTEAFSRVELTPGQLQALSKAVRS